MTPIQEKLKSLRELITGLHSTVDRLSKCFREDLETQNDSAFDKNSADDWRVNIYGNALVRLRIILEQNFREIETIGLVAVTRYIFELTLWLELIEQNVNYALIYRKQFIDTEIQYQNDSLSQLKREVALLNAFEEEDKRARTEAIKKLTALSNPTSEVASSILSQAMGETDAKAARSFSLYSDQAKTKGYAFQAHLVETKAIPQVEGRLRQLDQELEEFEREASTSVSGLLQCSNWKKMAEKVAMTDEYEYIYSYTSKLLHCTPFSVSTDQKNLEPDEIVVFLRYIHTRVRDIIDLALKQPECRIRSA
ncbi:hypothetical protein [Marinobacter adhaerens]|uniref:hypothetical protein n=1 Tax=Marinobacter adhaerens TaxID=1033846 RepID=UPI001C587AB9|nr:hypothetical protein [Marinobacter adhaerens]MBW3225295.1 hypothetical protein [Marinobacter adhaerens]